MKEKMTTSIHKRLESLVSDTPSRWEERALWRKENEAWLKKSAEIALKVLREIRAKSITQKELAERMGVSSQQINKLLKGQENMSLTTICKLEMALDISLIVVPGSYTVPLECNKFTGNEPFTPSVKYKTDPYTISVAACYVMDKDSCGLLEPAI